MLSGYETWKDIWLIYNWFIQYETLEYCGSLAGTSATIDNNCIICSKKTQKICQDYFFFSDLHVLNWQQHLRTEKDTKLSATNEGNGFSVYPKSLSIVDMLQLGKVVTKSPATVIEVSTFSTSSMSWSKLKRSVEFIFDKNSLG